MTLPQEEEGVCVSFWGLEGRWEVGGQKDPCGASKARRPQPSRHRAGGQETEFHLQQRFTRKAKQEFS